MIAIHKLADPSWQPLALPTGVLTTHQVLRAFGSESKLEAALRIMRQRLSSAEAVKK